MTEEKLDLKELIKYIDPAACTYSEWVEVGMALKHEGYSCDDWDEWSRPDKRYHAGDCEKKVEYLQRCRCTGYGGDYRSDGKR